MRNISLIAKLFALGYTLLFVLSFDSRAAVIRNGGFEDPIVPDRFLVFTAGQQLGTNGWTVIGPSGATVMLLKTTYDEPFGGYSLFDAQEGQNSLDITGLRNEGPNVGVSQVIDTVIGKGYEISFYVGRITPTGGPNDPYAHPATIDLKIDSGTRISFTNSDITEGRNNWKKFSYAFTALNDTTTISFLNATRLDTNQAGLDGISISSTIEPVPEPSTAWLIGLSLFGSIKRFWRVKVDHLRFFGNWGFGRKN
jgi:hypothetical protein